MNPQLFFKGAAAAALALTLGACGDGGTTVGGGGTGGTGGGGPSGSFIAAVNAVIASTSETLVPREIESIGVTSPEDTDPAALNS